MGGFGCTFIVGFCCAFIDCFAISFDSLGFSNACQRLEPKMSTDIDKHYYIIVLHVCVCPA